MRCRIHPPTTVNIGVPPVLMQTDCPGLKLLNRGKVRDILDLGDQLLIVATDRLSAFDVVMKTGIPGKGRSLTRISEFWLQYFRGVVDTHLITTNFEEFPDECQPYRDQLEGRSMLVDKAHSLPVECIVRGYLVGSGWKSYQENGTVCGIHLPPGLKEASKLSEPIFTPSTKATLGEHDVNISFEEMCDRVGRNVADVLRAKSLLLYRLGAEHARKKGIILADTKLEYGLIMGYPFLIDEALTPDSSRLWPADQYQEGMSPPSYDKQYVRDYLKNSGWKPSDGPVELPEEIVAGTRQRYLQAEEALLTA